MKLPIWLFFLLFCVGCQNTDEKDSHVLWGYALDGYPIKKSQLESLDSTELDPMIILFYLQWPKPGEMGEVPLQSLEIISQYSEIPCLTWEPMYQMDNKLHAIPYEDILAHKYDDYLERFATGIKTRGQPLIIRFAQEMNLDHYHWGTEASQFGPKSPEIYVKLFRYVVTFFKNKGVSNVQWAFCPNAESVPSNEWNKASHYYPGDEYVDILGMDGYDWRLK